MQKLNQSCYPSDRSLYFFCWDFWYFLNALSASITYRKLFSITWSREWILANLAYAWHCSMSDWGNSILIEVFVSVGLKIGMILSYLWFQLFITWKVCNSGWKDASETNAKLPYSFRWMLKNPLIFFVDIFNKNDSCHSTNPGTTWQRPVAKKGQVAQKTKIRRAPVYASVVSVWRCPYHTLRTTVHKPISN